MPTAALLVALCSAFVHALWNLLLSRARDSQAATAVALIVGVATFAPVAALTWDLESAALPYLGASAALEVAYFVLLARAYDRGRLSVVYPVARGSAPLLVLVLSIAIVGVRPSALAVVGILLIVGGVLLVRRVPPGEGGRELQFGLAIGACIATYTLFDKAALHHAAPLTYLELVVLPSAVVYPALMARRRGVAALRAETGAATVLAGLCMFGAFALTLVALRLATDAAVPAVQAVRETSVVMAVALAGVVLGEDITRGRILGAALVVLGVAALAAA